MLIGGEPLGERPSKLRELLIVEVQGEQAGEHAQLLVLQVDDALTADRSVEHEGEVAQRG